MAIQKNIIYNPSETLKRFHAGKGLYRFILGPVGSGKTTGCCLEILSRASNQKPQEDGVARTRFLVARNSIPQLRDTTIKTWFDWVKPEVYGEYNQTTFTHYLKFNVKKRLAGGKEEVVRVESEILFRPLDTIDDIRRVLSLEITGAFLNEVREIPKGLVDAIGDRVGRYPSMRDGGCTWRGVVGDTNPPDEDHWYYRMAEEIRPEGWNFYRQPGGLIEVAGEFVANPKAENLENLERDYYISRMHGKDKDFIRVYYCAQYGFVKDGKPVVPEYVDAVHCSEKVLWPVPGIPIYVGLDFGLTPAATFAQKQVLGQWIVFDELCTEDMGAVRFAELLSAKMKSEYDGFEFDIWGDPAGDQRAGTDERTPYMILDKGGIKARPTHTNDPVIRREALAVPLSRMIDGRPGLVISPKCKTLRKGLAGGYCYKRIKVSGDEKYQDKPDKNRYSHVVDSIMYLLLGAGEGRSLVRTVKQKGSGGMQSEFNFTGSWMM